MIFEVSTSISRDCLATSALALGSFFWKQYDDGLGFVMSSGCFDERLKQRDTSMTPESTSSTTGSTSYSEGPSTRSSSSESSGSFVPVQSHNEISQSLEIGAPDNVAPQLTHTSARVHPVYTAPKPALRFVNITDPKQTKTHRFKTDVRSQAMTSHMWNKRTRPQGITKKDTRAVAAPGASLDVLKKRTQEANKASPLTDVDIEGVDLYDRLLLQHSPEMEGYKNDPFGMFPTIEGDIHVNVPQMVHHGVRMYSTDHIDILSFWTHSTSPLNIIPSLLVISEHIDLLNGLSRDSKRTVALRSKSLSLLNDHLQNPGSIDDDLTIMTITKMLSSEQITCGDGVTVHQSALQRVVDGRGGLQLMQQKTPFMGPYVTSVVLFHCIIHELRPVPHWTNFPPHEYRFATSIAHQGAKHADICGDDSSVYSPHMMRGPKMGFIGQLVEPFTKPSDLVEFLPIRHSKYFSQHAHELLITLRNAMNIFLGLGEDSSKIGVRHRKPPDTTDTQADLKAVLLHTQLLPSAADISPQNPVSGDWQYECCRLTCLVTFTSMYLRIPFSQSNHLLASRYSSVLPTTAFGAALLRTDLVNCWSDMSAILTFLVILMAAASSKITPLSKEHDYRARKWIVMTYMRSCITLGFEPGWAFNGLLRLLVDVQARLTNGQDVP